MKRTPEVPLPDDSLTVRQAARRLGLSRQAVLGAVMRGLIDVARLAGTRLLLLDRASVETYPARKSRRGRKATRKPQSK